MLMLSDVVMCRPAPTQVAMTPEQSSLYKAAVQKVRDEVMAAVEAANLPNAAAGSAAGRNARARNLNTKYFNAEGGELAPIPITKRKRGRPAKKKPNEEPAIGIMDGLGLEGLGMSSGPSMSEGGTQAMSTMSGPGSRGGSEATPGAGDQADTAGTSGTWVLVGRVAVCRLHACWLELLGVRRRNVSRVAQCILSSGYYGVLL
jgi:hypothetical protein